MTEGLVGLGHLVGLFFAAHRAAGVVHRVHELAGESLGHRLARTLAGGLDDPAHRERRAPIRADLDGDLVGRAADAPGLHFDQGHRVLERRLEHVDARLARRGLGERERAVDDAFGGRALAVAHHVVVVLLKRMFPVHTVRITETLYDACSPYECLVSLIYAIWVLRSLTGSDSLSVVLCH